MKGIYIFFFSIFVYIIIIVAYQGCDIGAGSEQTTGQKIVNEAIKYKDYDTKLWYGRRSLYTSPNPRTGGSCCDPGMGLCACWPVCSSTYPNRKGVAYSYGNKDTPTHFEQNLILQ